VARLELLLLLLRLLLLLLRKGWRQQQLGSSCRAANLQQRSVRCSMSGGGGRGGRVGAAQS
jgi:hypothetical protein